MSSPEDLLEPVTEDEIRLSTQAPHGFPSRRRTVHRPRSRAVPTTAIADAEGGVRASIEDEAGFFAFWIKDEKPNEAELR